MCNSLRRNWSFYHLKFQWITRDLCKRLINYVWIWHNPNQQISKLTFKLTESKLKIQTLEFLKVKESIRNGFCQIKQASCGNCFCVEDYNLADKETNRNEEIVRNIMTKVNGSMGYILQATMFKVCLSPNFIIKSFIESFQFLSLSRKIKN